MEDQRLLRQYVESGSQAAFSRLVEKHYGQVYSTCRRELGDNSLAEDAAQVVFLILARKAKSLRNEVVLSGWLFRTARFAAIDIRKQDIRRQRRDGRVGDAMVRESQQYEETWAEIDPLLHDSIAELCEKDRIAILLRFFEDASFADIGEALGQKEDATRHRLGRALAKMHRFLTKKGVVLPVSALATLLAANALNPTSAVASSLAAAKLCSAVAGGSAATHLLGSQVNLFAQGVIRTMWIKQVSGVTAAAAAVIVIGSVAAATGFGLVRSNATSLPAASRPVAAMARPAPSIMRDNPTVAAIRVVSQTDLSPLIPASAIDGKWEGTLDFGRSSLRFVLKATHDSAGELHVQAQSPDQSDTFIPMESPTFRHGTFTFHCTFADYAFKGTMSAGNQSISGSFTQLGKTVPLVLDKTAHPSSEGIQVSGTDVSTLTGTWEGRLGTGPGSIRLDVIISQLPSGRLTATVDSPDQGSTMAPAALQFSKRMLQINVALVNGKYSGTLGSDNTSFTGSWIQYGTPEQPLNLAKIN